MAKLDLPQTFISDFCKNISVTEGFSDDEEFKKRICSLLGKINKKTVQNL